MMTSRTARACRLEADWARIHAQRDFRHLSHPLLMTESSLTRVVPPFSELAAVLARSKYLHSRNERRFSRGLLNLLPTQIRVSNTSCELRRLRIHCSDAQTHHYAAAFQQQSTH